MQSPNFKSKTEARAWALQRRAALSPAEHRAISDAAIQILLNSAAFSVADTLLCYVGVKGGELDTEPLVRAAIERGMNVLVPMCRPGGLMVWSRLQRLEELEMTSKGILEPAAAWVRLEEPHEGLCIVPGLCFRRDGHRIGFGAGYYDRFLCHFRGDTVALTPECLLGVEFPVASHDIPVASMVTESGMYRAAPTSV